MSDLKPCPFCGGEAEAVHEINGFWTVECIKCGALVDGIAAWNNRAELVNEMCKLKHASWDDGQCTWGCVCTACDAHFEHETGIGYNYCPNCGAKVVSKGERK